MSVFRIYVEKKDGFDAQAKSVYRDIKDVLGIGNLRSLRLINRYDVEGMHKSDFKKAIPTIFSEPAVDKTYDALGGMGKGYRVFATEYLPGQFDQRADSCEQCIQLLTQGERPTVRSALVYILEGELSEDAFAQIKKHLINPVESREASLATVTTLKTDYDIPTEVETLVGFNALGSDGLSDFVQNYGLAMDLDDIAFCQRQFREVEKREPTITEIRMIDTYWSDHCRHTTFLTQIDAVTIADNYIQDTYNIYTQARELLYKGRTDKPVTLMDLAVIGAKKLKADGILKDLDESEEINACSVRIKVDINGQEEDWLLMFKNETHNHPTEIEPFGGAATCLGGAIRDPLSGRSYVYQAMRVTGAANPLVAYKDTMKSKLPQRKLVTTAADGYSSYGNQIGLATGHVTEIYHDNYVAKRMEIGAVIGAAPAKNVVRQIPQDGDAVILLGGKTGRDGCGGATGSSKSHTVDSLEECGAEVQKGNPPEERKIQRLFRKEAVTTMIKRCNDFGAGGISVAIGELADGLKINLDAVPKKYDGLDGTELAISESQERMAVVVSPENVQAFINEAEKENLQATKVAEVTGEPRLRMNWNGRTIVDLPREFLNSNGAEKHTTAEILPAKQTMVYKRENTEEGWTAHLTDLNMASQKGLVERFDSTIGAGTVTMPFGGAYQMTPTQAMVAKIPVLKGQTDTASVMAWGYNPFISEKSPYHGAMYAVIESVSKVIAAGGSAKQCWLTFQEYFERMKDDPKRWGKPMAALLGAFRAQMELGIGSIGGKDSMSGTFEEIDVPPTLVSFAVSVTKAQKALSPEFKKVGSSVILLKPKYDNNGLPNFASVQKIFEAVENLVQTGKALSVWALSGGGISEGIAKMAFGNRIGFTFIRGLEEDILFNGVYGGFLIEVNKEDVQDYTAIGYTTHDYYILHDKMQLDLLKLQQAWEAKLESVFSCNISYSSDAIPNVAYAWKGERITAKSQIAKPKVLIPVFPGTNCEYDSARAFEKEGAQAEVFVINNRSSKNIEESVNAFEKAIRTTQIIMLPGGFSGGDEPEGAAKFIVSFFKNPRIKEAVEELLHNRDGLMLGICNGFQALVKLGLLPYGEIRDMQESSPTLTFNTINRHQSKMVYTKVASNQSPWLSLTNTGDIHTIAISHGEGRFVASLKDIDVLINNGQIATQYVDQAGNPTYDIAYNPNGSTFAIEGITSKDGRVFGKMGHSERYGENICKNVPGEKHQPIFRAGVSYFQ